MHGNDGSLADLAGDVDMTMHRGDEPVADGEAKTDPARIAAIGIGNLDEGLQHILEPGGGNAGGGCDLALWEYGALYSGEFVGKAEGDHDHHVYGGWSEGGAADPSCTGE